MPGEGRDLSSRQTQDVARDLEIGQPINSEQRSETADGVARESEGRTRLSVLRPLRQNQPRRYSGARLGPAGGSLTCARSCESKSDDAFAPHLSGWNHY